MNSQNAPDDEIDLGQLLRNLWQGRFWIILSTSIGVALGAFTIANTRPTFQSDALLQLEEKSGALALPSSLTAAIDNDPRSVTEIEILRSRMVLGRAVAEQNLDWQISPELAPLVGVMLSRYQFPWLDTVIPARFARPGESIALENLVVPPSMLNQDIRLTVESETQFRIVLPDGAALVGRVGEPVKLSDQGFSLTVAAINAPAERRFDIRQIDEVRAINALRARLTVAERGRASGILEVRLTGENRSGNTNALNAIVQSYLGQNIARSAAEADSSLEFIREQLPQAAQTLRTAEAALNAFRLEQSTVDLSLETQSILSQITRIESELAVLQRREDELSWRFAESHPTYRQLLDERGRLEERLTALRRQVSELPEIQRQILNLSREVDLAQRIYTELMTRAQEVEVLRASTIGNVRVVDDAGAAPLPVAPRKTLILAVAMVLGAITGIGIVLMRNWMRKGVQDAAEIEKLGLPVFATINYSERADTHNRRDRSLSILAFDSMADLTIEGIRSLRTSLHFGMLDAGSPSLTITSSHPGAGKSFLSVNLAAVAAQAGQRVCLIDADLRRGQLRRYFDQPRDLPGLAEVLAGDISFTQAIVKGKHENLFLLPTGRYPPNPSEMLMRQELAKLVEACSKHFDLVIFDTPPMLAVTDPVIIARSTGACMLLVRHEVTPVGEIVASQKTLASAGLKFSGAVFNGFDPRKARAGYGYGYNYSYRYQYNHRE